MRGFLGSLFHKIFHGSGGRVLIFLKQIIGTGALGSLLVVFAKGNGKRGHIVAHDVSWAAQTGKHLLRTQNVSEQNQKHFLCHGRNKCYARGKTGKHLCRQQCECVLVCQGLNKQCPHTGGHAQEVSTVVNAWPGQYMYYQADN